MSLRTRSAIVGVRSHLCGFYTACGTNGSMPIQEQDPSMPATLSIPTVRPDEEAGPRRQGTAALTIAALGIVYGDIGTSPLYTVKEVFSASTGVPLNPETLVGAVSVIFWALMLVVTLKYVALIMRA